jgi:hypothetical protein
MSDATQAAPATHAELMTAPGLSPAAPVRMHGRRPSAIPIGGRRAGEVDASTWAAIAIVLVGALLRLYTIVRFTWDQDELYTIEEARDLFHTKLPPGINARPLFYLLEHPLLALLPHTPAMLRVLPFVFGVAGLWVTWLVGRRHVGRVGGLVAVFLASASTWHMETSGQSRYYSLVYLCTALLLLWLPDAYDSERPRRYLGALAAMVLGTLTHPSFVFPVIGIVVATSIVTREGRLQLPWPSAKSWRWLWIPFLTFIGLFFVALQLAHRGAAIRNSVGRGDAATLRLLPAIVEWMTPAVFGAALVATVCLLLSRSTGRRRVGAIALLSVAVTLGGLFAASFWTAIYATYATGLLAVAFVAAGGLAELVSEATYGRRPLTVAAIAIALLGFAVSPSVASHLSDGTRFDYRPAYAQILREAPATPVVAWPAVLAQTYAPSLTLLPYRPERAYFDSLLVRHPEVWVVASVKRAGIALDDTGDVDRWLAANCRRRGSYERPRYDYRLYRVELYRCSRSQ